MRRQANGRRSNAGIRTFLVLALTGCMLIVVLMAASVDSPPVFTNASRSADATPPTATRSTSSAPANGLLPVQKRGVSTGLAIFGVLGVVVLVLLVMLVTLILVMAARTSLAVLRRRSSSAAHASQTDPMPLGSTRADAVAQALADLQRAVAEGSPRAGIIAAWVRLERVAADSGVPPRTSETPAELTIRVLDGMDVPGRYVLRLADLYREARFSEHPMTEADRAEAAQCVQIICSATPHQGAPQVT